MRWRTELLGTAVEVHRGNGWGNVGVVLTDRRRGCAPCMVVRACSAVGEEIRWRWRAALAGQRPGGGSPMVVEGEQGGEEGGDDDREKGVGFMPWRLGR